MKRFRTVLFWLHLLSGVTAGTVILIMSATGVILALKPQLQDWIDRDVRYVAQQTVRLGAQQLLAAVKAAKPESSPQSVTVARDPALAATVGFGREGNLYVNPYTGTILGTGSARTNEFFQSMTRWHRYLATTGESRATGRSATGISNFAFLILAISGLYIWWPKQFTRKGLRPIVWFRQTSTGRARDFNWHNTIGFWCLIPIVIMTASGVVMSYSWANDLVYRLTGSPVPVRGGGPGGPAAGIEGGLGRGGRGGEEIGGGRGRGPERPATDQMTREDSSRPRADREGGAREPGARGPQRDQASAVIPVELDRIWTRAEQQVPTWSLLSMRLPNREGAPVAFTITDGANWNAFARSNLTLNSFSGDIVQWQPYEGNSLGQKLRGWLRFAHTGELGGLPGQIVAGLGCLGGVFLVYTGLSLACRRLWNWTLWKRLGIAARRSPRVPSTAPAPSTSPEPALE
jgi:uncharacterized iron-regulated membrane protein